jgi:NHS family xanthosine MFS transporter
MGQTFGPIEGGSIGLSIGRTYGSMGASLFMPALLGIIADKYFSAQKFLGFAHIIAGIAIYFATQIQRRCIGLFCNQLFLYANYCVE